ncbi:MAG TPA: hypothetical protein DD670_12935 [Planctomycetaceae bacterium]|nr:hypothetical protein [Planctomycetaceae bacterium]
MTTLLAAFALALDPCRVEVVEKGTGWPVPLVELRTTNHLRFVTDNAGLIALDAPELMGRETWFWVHGHGYEVKKDGFGFQGVRLTPEPGKTLRVEVSRTNLAKRLGRLTGAGLFAESQKLGEELDWRESGITGCDSLQSTVHRGRRFWLWGDTGLFHYPLGIFHGSSATTPVEPGDVFEPPVRLKLDYFVNDRGVPRNVAEMPGAGPTWVTGYVSLPDKDGNARLVGSYCKVRQPMEAYEWGVCVWNDEQDKFELSRIVWTKSDESPEPPPLPQGHAVPWTDKDGKQWILFADPFPTMRIPATFEAWNDPSTWETIEPQETIPTADGGEAVKPHRGSIAWHPWRKRWVMIFTQIYGKPSLLGEIWYAEADAPTGPWGGAVKVLSHDKYTFYNPLIHLEWLRADSPILLFEGTYTMSFSGQEQPTPRYDYNQVLYRLDLDDPRVTGDSGK